LVTTGPVLLDNEGPREYKATARYRDVTGREYQHRYTLNISEFKDELLTDEKTITDVVRQLERIAKELREIAGHLKRNKW